VAAVEIHRGDVEIRAMSGLSTTAAAAVERCALGIRGRPAATSSLRRAVAQRRPAALTAFRRWPVAPRAVATTPADPDVRLALSAYSPSFAALHDRSTRRFVGLGLNISRFRCSFCIRLPGGSRWNPTPSSRYDSTLIIDHFSYEFVLSVM
jgi:hypothetical protein